MSFGNTELIGCKREEVPLTTITIYCRSLLFFPKIFLKKAPIGLKIDTVSLALVFIEFLRFLVSNPFPKSDETCELPSVEAFP